jgi:hypothetical protein
MKIYSNNSLTYRLEFIALIYFTLTLIASANLTLTGDNSYFWKAHFAFIASFIIILFLTNTLSVVITQFVRNFGGVCLLLFLFYYFIMTVGYPNPQISSNHLRCITREVIPGFLLGFVFSGKIEILRVHEFPKLSQSIRSILLNSPIIVSLLFYLFIVIAILAAMWSIRRTDIFLITNIADLDQLYYQTFGKYSLLAFIGALMILYYYLKQKRNYYIIFCFIVICLGFIVIITLAMVGSNKELVALTLILFMCISYAKPKHFLLKHNKIYLGNLLIVLLVLLLCGAAWFCVSGIELPYLRIFGFQESTSVLESRSLISRIEMFMDTGIEQIAINPVFGNLGAEYIVGRPGGYIHSLISVQSHLGMIGTFLLLGYLTHRLYRLYANDGRSVLKMITPSILFISFIGTFFTWLPFWFLIGALFAPRKDP